MVRPPGASAEQDQRMQELYDLHARPLFRFCLRLTLGQQQAAEDLMQETLLRAWRNVEGLHTDITTLRPWLFTVARRIAIDVSRARAVRPSEIGTVDLSVLPVDEDLIDRMLDAHTIRAALLRLSPEHRTAIVEIYYRGRSAREAADLLGIPEGTVKSRTYLALRSLRAELMPARTEDGKGG